MINGGDLMVDDRLLIINGVVHQYASTISIWVGCIQGPDKRSLERSASQEIDLQNTALGQFGEPIPSMAKLLVGTLSRDVRTFLVCAGYGGQ